jgi:putative ABC transport system permease protein
LKNYNTNLKKTVQFIEEQWKSLFPNKIFNYYFLDERIHSFYKEEQDTAKLLDIFSIIAVSISCMGLFGITLYQIERKSKEIAIRRVNGASIGVLLRNICWNYFVWFVIAIVISVPITVYIMSIWLEKYAYKTKLSWWVFALAGLIVFAIVIITVGWQSWRAAKSNPIEALKSE